MSAVSPNTWPAAPVCTKTGFYTNNWKGNYNIFLLSLSRKNNRKCLTQSREDNFFYFDYDTLLVWAFVKV